MAYLIAEYIVWMMKEKVGALKVYAWVIAVLTIILDVAYLAVRWGAVPDSIFHGKHAADNVAMLHALADYPIANYIFVVMSLYLAYRIIVSLKKKDVREICGSTLATIIGLFLLLDTSLQPAVLNTKADKPLAPMIEQRFDMNKLYSYIPTKDLHFFSLNFYLGDKIQQFEKVLPQDGVLMIPEDCFEEFKEKYGKGYVFQKDWEIKKAVEWHSPIGFYRFVKSEPTLALR